MKKQEILRAALVQYSKYGYQGATMRKIAEEVGIKPASIYFFFPSKEALFTEACRQILENHHNAMKNVLHEHAHEPVNFVFSAILQGIVDHHTGDFVETAAYISLVTAPIPEIKPQLQNYMLAFNDWLIGELENALQNSYPAISTEDINRTIKQFVLLGNGVFWGINLYEGDYLKEQLALADQLIQSLLKQLELSYS